METPRIRARPPTITGPRDFQPQSLDLGVHEESEDDPWEDEDLIRAPGAEVLCSNDDMDEDNEILFEIPRIWFSASTSGWVCLWHQLYFAFPTERCESQMSDVPWTLFRLFTPTLFRISHRKMLIWDDRCTISHVRKSYTLPERESIRTCVYTCGSDRERVWVYMNERDGFKHIYMSSVGLPPEGLSAECHVWLFWPAGINTDVRAYIRLDWPGTSSNDPCISSEVSSLLLVQSRFP